MRGLGQLAGGRPRLRLARRITAYWVAAAWLAMAGLAAAQYSIIDLGDLGGAYARARAINDLGQVVGEALLPGALTVDRAVTWQAGTVADLGTLGGQQSAALGINNSGIICGWAQNASGTTLPTLWSGGGVTALPTLGGSSGAAYGINNAGTAVGQASLSSGDYHAAVWSGGGVRDLGTLGGTLSVAYDINNQGAVVGTASNAAGKDQAVLWGSSGPVDLGGLSGGQFTAAVGVNDSGQVILWGTPLGTTANHAAFWNGNPSSPAVDLGTFGGDQSWAYGLNDHGFVVGSAYEPNGTYHAFVWNGVDKTDLGTLGGFYSLAYAINDEGDVAGLALDASGQTHAVEWVLVPEPAASLLGLLAMGIISVCRRSSRRKRLEQASRCPKIQSGRGSSGF